MRLAAAPTSGSPAFREMHDRRREPRAVGVGEQDREARLHHADERVRRPKINPDNVVRHRQAQSLAFPDGRLNRAGTIPRSFREPLHERHDHEDDREDHKIWIAAPRTWKPTQPINQRTKRMIAIVQSITSYCFVAAGVSLTSGESLQRHLPSGRGDSRWKSGVFGKRIAALKLPFSLFLALRYLNRSALSFPSSLSSRSSG